MQLTVLGCSAAYPRPGGACSGYIVEEGGTKLLIDCGSGVLGHLQLWVAPMDISHIVISHLHADHVIDLIPYCYALSRPVNEGLRPHLHLPPKGVDTLLRVASALNISSKFISNHFWVEEYDVGELLEVGDLSIKFAPVKHYIPSYAMAIFGGKMMVYSGDSGPCDELAELARGADLFLCEATRSEADDAEWGHLSAGEAGALARGAEVQRLVLTHFFPDCDYSQNLEQARAAFGNAIEVAEEFCTYLL